MVGINKMPCLVPVLVAHGAGAERREELAHGVSRGICGQNRTSPGGASENKSHSVTILRGFACSFNCFAPAVACRVWGRYPTANAVGYQLSPLRGWHPGNGSRTRMNPPAQNGWLIPALAVRAAKLSALAHGAGAERRQRVARGASRGSGVKKKPSPLGAGE